jgi:UDP-N-acetylglucosamine 2-epimerase (non-hydrolysing)
VFPVHPRTRDRLDASGLGATLGAVPGLHLTAPLGYVEMLALMQRAELVLTDSGGVQEETTYLGVPCLTLRDNTERPATVSDGTNRVVGTRPETLRSEIGRLLDGNRPAPRRPPLWDGHAAERVAEVLATLGERTTAVAAGASRR